jgi:sigma-54 dependent transcriptional regulator, acetoin dehydrogenase operon transcriptional activator AcoR
VTVPAISQHASHVLRFADGLDPARARALGKPIGDSWRRCAKDYALDPARLSAPVVITSSELKELHARNDELVQIAAHEMDALCDQIAGSGYALLLTDASGVILHERLDPALRGMFRSAGLVAGADWSERHEGTNGIGTCIVENRPVTVHRAEHFRARHISLSCSGAPVHDPCGELAAVLDASSVNTHDTRASQAHTMALVNLSAQLIERGMFLRRYAASTVVRFHTRPEFVNLLHDGALALSDDGTIVAADETALRLLRAQSRRAISGRALDIFFELRPEDVLSSAQAASQVVRPVRERLHGRRFYLSVYRGKALVELLNPLLPARHTRNLVSIPRVTQRPPVLDLEALAGDDPQMLRNAQAARRIADAAVAVLIQGPTGSGKEAFARAVHAASRRALQPFVAVNCAALPEALIESELFGYRPGAFTGASKEGRRGKIQQSSGGTLFLDEIGDMPPLLQTRLLRVLEEREIVPLGGDVPIKVDLHVISATHRNLRAQIERGEFREDLYYRLNGLTMELPALACRADKDRLIRRFLASEACSGQSAVIESDALDVMLAYQWPGNIRQLCNVIRTALAICEEGVVRLRDLPREVCEHAGAGAPPASDAAAPVVVAGAKRVPVDVPAGSALAKAEREVLLQAIEASAGNMSAVARQLGISRNSLYRKLKRHAICVGPGSRMPAR